MTGQIIANGVESLTPAITRTQEIGLEMVNYVGYIGLAVLGITIAYYGVKMIIRYIQDNVLYWTFDKNRRQRRNRMKKKETKRFEETYDNFF